ncbi:MAG: 3-hydroxyacyl-CoA dehydrogenase family protein [Burkholderiales bacterium]|nr:3-hydroxyacyl-CoA dehydrogenase family protein [Burkholderiales bacterium]
MRARVAVIGAGVMGHGIAQAFAASGSETTLIDTHAGALRTALVRIRQNLSTLVGLEVMSAAQARSALGRISVTTRLSEGVAGADFVQETIPEDLRLKRSLFASLSELPERAIIASNAATIPISRLAASMKARRRMIGAHWIGPPHIVPVVEVIPSKWTAPVVTRRTREILTGAGKVPVVCADIPGKIILRIQFAMLNEAIHLLDIGAASAQDIDTAVRLSTGLRLPVFGPLRQSDFVSTHGNTLKGLRFLYGATGDKKYRPSKRLAGMVKKGEQGIWTGKGWYAYSEDYETLARRRDRVLVRLLSMLGKIGDRGINRPLHGKRNRSAARGGG